MHKLKNLQEFFLFTKENDTEFFEPSSLGNGKGNDRKETQDCHFSKQLINQWSQIASGAFFQMLLDEFKHDRQENEEEDNASDNGDIFILLSYILGDDEVVSDIADTKQTIDSHVSLAELSLTDERSKPLSFSSFSSSSSGPSSSSRDRECCAATLDICESTSEGFKDPMM